MDLAIDQHFIESNLAKFPRVIFVGGTSGSGKSTIARALACRLGYGIRDGDDYHSAESRAKMNAGTPLTDEDRLPWLRKLAEMAHDDHSGHEMANGPQRLVIACSALKSAYRQILVNASTPADCRIVMLRVSKHVLAQRLESRQDHFFNKSLLSSQLATLELPETLDVSQIESTAAREERKDEKNLANDSESNAPTINSEPHVLIVNGDQEVEKIIETILRRLIK